MNNQLLRYCARSFSSQSSDLSNKIFVVFGATGGIGSELCRRLSLHENSHIILSGRDEQKLQSLANELPQTSTTVLVADPLDPLAVEQVTSQTINSHGHLTGVANCVGSVLLKPAHTTSSDEFDTILKTNLYTSFNIIKSSVKHMMKTGGGSIVLCSSAVAGHGIPNHEAIAAAKGGISSLAKSAAATYGGKNIRVNCVAPGLTRTPMTSRITGSEAAMKASLSMHAIKRIGEPGDVASALEFFLNPENSWITGQVLAVDGGLSSVRAS
jgi:3-oxoacyl-[acyl-carrier protein] reductase